MSNIKLGAEIYSVYKLDQEAEEVNRVINEFSALERELDQVEKIAKGRNTGYVFDTYEAMTEWVNKPENTAQLVLGDNLYIKAVDVPDYWWDGEQVQQLETQKVDLSEYYDKEEIDNTFATKEEIKDKFDDTYTKEQVDAKISGVYKVCGSATTSTLPYGTAQLGDVYNLSVNGETIAVGVQDNIVVNSFQNEHIPVGEIYIGEKELFVYDTRGINLLKHFPKEVSEKTGNTNHIIVLFRNKSAEEINPEYPEETTETVMLPNAYLVGTGDGLVVISWDDEPYFEKTSYSNDEFEIQVVEWGFQVEDGDNVVWTETGWDKLAASIDTTQFATKTELNQRAYKSTTLKGYGITDAYTKSEVDFKIGGVYKPCGGAFVEELQNKDLSTEAIGNVYNALNDGVLYQHIGVYQGAGMPSITSDFKIPIEHGGLNYEERYIYVLHSSNDDLLYSACLVAENYMQITNKTKENEDGYHVTEIHNIKLEEVADTYIKISWLDDVSFYEGNENTDEYEITYIEYEIPVKEGDNILWTGDLWDKLSSYIDTSSFATEETLNAKADKATTLSGYGITDSYTKEEIDSKFGGIYRFCGSATVNNYQITAYPTRVGDVYNIATGGKFSTGATVSIPFVVPYPEDSPNYIYLENTEDVTVLATVAGYSNCMVWLGSKDKTSTELFDEDVVIITNIRFMWIEGIYGGEVTFDIHPQSPIQDASLIDTENWQIYYMEYDMEVESGDNIVWTGKIWDKLSGTVDTTGFATKTEVETLRTEVENIVPLAEVIIRRWD